MSDVALEYDNPFWRFSTKLYRLETVEMSCIYLQDHQGVMVNHLLFSCWLSTQNVCYSQDWAQQVEPIIGWHNQFVVPLRKQRRHLKAMAQAEPRLQEMREHLLEAEMIAEQHEQALLYLMYALKKGVQNCTDRTTALRNNMAFVLKDAKMTKIATDELANLLALVVDEEIARQLAAEF
ncbi:TIGR02444 family protein [Oceanospirillum multiglobuliferum]|uniref:TIGR02444 family protein n=1 Tax=Oceanospirillum multiglobuliferum TaxID=64969 RepID=A0A1T4LW28_9GAMM|nr:TIGR02444 family protein [Oceanospirillum multiglobuliferum]OPX56340.1 TIGR02444 family protein [Oceanospirillum multiglobuliferum]SJZ58949.1 TIGR02444 family protein [Oceanospirillum multiglobuliferum]